MDASASLPSSKLQKVFEGQDASQDKDVISRFPDDTLVHILSFLSTEEAIKTSRLSKRWKFLWMSVPNFCFCDSSVWSRTMGHDQILVVGAKFLDSVERAVLVRNASCAGKFRRWLTMLVGASRVHSWLSAAVKHKVEKLNLFLPKEVGFLLPNSLFTSKSLSSFRLTKCSTLKLPSFICFSSLKDLNLGGVMFQDDHSIQRLFSGFPVLEDLTLDDCDWENIKEITIEIPTLRSLTFSENGFFKDNFLNFKIIISALNLETLDVYSYLKVELLSFNLPSLNEASINFYNLTDGQQEQSHRLVNLLRGLDNAKSLKLSNEALESLFLVESIQQHLPTFYNLTTLNACVNNPYADNDYTSGALMYMLQKSPNLNFLILSRGFKPEDQGMIMDVVPGCFQSCLNAVRIFNIDGDEEELSFLKYLYENAPVLEWLYIGCSPELSEDSGKQQEIRHQLQQLRGCAGSCTIVFDPYPFP